MEGGALAASTQPVQARVADVVEAGGHHAHGLASVETHRAAAEAAVIRAGPAGGAAFAAFAARAAAAVEELPLHPRREAERLQDVALLLAQLLQSCGQVGLRSGRGRATSGAS